MAAATTGTVLTGAHRATLQRASRARARLACSSKERRPSVSSCAAARTTLSRSRAPRRRSCSPAGRSSSPRGRSTRRGCCSSRVCRARHVNTGAGPTAPPHTHCVARRGRLRCTTGATGIGPREWLEPLGIPVVADLPVGKNLQDHLFTVQVRARPSAADGERRKRRNAGAVSSTKREKRTACATLHVAAGAVVCAQRHDVVPGPLGHQAGHVHCAGGRRTDQRGGRASSSCSCSHVQTDPLCPLPPHTHTVPAHQNGPGDDVWSGGHRLLQDGLARGPRRAGWPSALCAVCAPVGYGLLRALHAKWPRAAGRGVRTHARFAVRTWPEMVGEGTATNRAPR